MAAYTRSPGPVPALHLSAQDVVHLADGLVACCAEFSELFLRKEPQAWALKHLQGLVQPEAGKSVERLALRVPGGNVRNMQQFIGEGAWDDAAILGKHAALVAASLGEVDGQGGQLPGHGVPGLRLAQGAHAVGPAPVPATGVVRGVVAGALAALSDPVGDAI